MSNLIQVSQVLEKTNLARSTLGLYVKQGSFPAGVRLRDGARRVYWVESEVDAWLQSRIKGSRPACAAVPA
jgi:prophage regulatory protein